MKTKGLWGIIPIRLVSVVTRASIVASIDKLGGDNVSFASLPYERKRIVKARFRSIKGTSSKAQTGAY